MTHEELKECIGEYRELKKDLWWANCWGVQKVDGYNFGIHYNDFAGHWQFSWNDPENEHRVADVEDIFDNQEDCEEYWEFGNITKTQTLKTPNYEQIEIYMDNMKRFGLNHSDRVLARIITKDSIYYLKLCKDLDIFTFQLKQTYIGEDLCEQLSSKFPKPLGKATKENYDNARRICVKLFRGESV